MGGVLITGAARRIGRTLALALAKDGWDVAIHCHSSREEADKVAAEARQHGVRAAVLAADLQAAETPGHLVAEAGAAIGPLSALINNASRFEPDEIDTVTLESWDRHLAVNLRAPVFLAQAFAAQLPVGAQGNIVNIIDQRVWKLNPQFFSYTASKAGLWAVTRTLAQALAPRIRVNAIAPGPTLPNARMRESEFDRLTGLTPLQRGTTPDEIASAVGFLLAAPAITGQMIAVDGGQHLAWQTPDVVDVSE